MDADCKIMRGGIHWAHGEQLREIGKELSMVRHTESIRRAQLEAKNEMLKKQLQEREPLAENELLILKI